MNNTPIDLIVYLIFALLVILSLGSYYTAIGCTTSGCTTLHHTTGFTLNADVFTQSGKNGGYSVVESIQYPCFGGGLRSSQSNCTCYMTHATLYPLYSNAKASSKKIAINQQKNIWILRSDYSICYIQAVAKYHLDVGITLLSFIGIVCIVIPLCGWVILTIYEKYNDAKLKLPIIIVHHSPNEPFTA